jgi:molybdopterin/thiamine biosynthesis adenylyltransferase/rhodanese-related sulfurtransferase
MMLTKEEHARYSRQTILPEFGLEGQLKLQAAKVLVVGAGGLGCPILQYLAAAGMGDIGIIDDDVVTLSNLHRQILYNEADLGKSKASVAKTKLEFLNPHVRITAYNDRLTTQNAAQIFQHYDLIIDGSDNFETRYLVNDTCVAINKPLVFGSIYKFEGQVSVFNYNAGPNYRDLYSAAPDPGETPNCSDIGVLGVLAGVVGLYMAIEAIKISCGVGQIISGILMTIDALNNTTNYFKLNKINAPASNSPAPTPDNPALIITSPTQTITSPNSLAASSQALSNLSVDNQAIKTSAIASPEQVLPVNEIPKKTMDQWLIESNNNTMLIDVREEYEFEEYNIGGINIPLYELAEQLSTIEHGKHIIFLCENGQRSKIAVQISRYQYKGSVYSLKHGINKSNRA